MSSFPFCVYCWCVDISSNPPGVQETLGLDILVHGEAERTDMVEFFGQQLEGFAFTSNGWVQVPQIRARKHVYGVVKMFQASWEDVLLKTKR